MSALTTLKQRVADAQEQAASARPHIREEGAVAFGVLRSTLDAIETDVDALVAAEAATPRDEPAGG